MEKCPKCGKTAVTSWTTLEKKCSHCGARYRKIQESARRSNVDDSYTPIPSPSFDPDPSPSWTSSVSDGYSSGGGDFGGGGSSSDW